MEGTAFATVHEWLNGDGRSGVPRIVQGGIQALILLNVAALVLETVQSIGDRYRAVFLAIEHVSIALFAIEYLARITSCVADQRFRGGVVGRIRYALTPMALIDLLAIAPAIMPILGGADLRSFRAVRLMRVFRILKVARYSRALHGLRGAVMSSYRSGKCVRRPEVARVLSS